MRGAAELRALNEPPEIKTMSTGTVKLHRVLKAPAERIFKAFVDADAMAKWLPPHGFTGKVHAFRRSPSPP